MAVKSSRPAPADVFPELRKLLEPYAKKLHVKQDNEKWFYLESVGDLEVNGRPYKEVMFAAAGVMKGFAGFYFFPIYTHPKSFSLDPELKKLLKGKSCFHVKALTPELKKKLAALLKEGYALYKSCGIVS